MIEQKLIQDGDITRAMYAVIETGLHQRGFFNIGTGKESSKGGCHTPDKNHYILFTDGMIIYSSIPDYDQKKLHPDEHPNAVVKEWFCNTFSFWELDQAMVEVNINQPNQRKEPDNVVK